MQYIDTFKCCSEKLLKYLISFPISFVKRKVLSKLNWKDCSGVKLVQLYPNNTATIITKWHWHDCSQVRLLQLFPSETGTIVPKWYWHDCSQVTLAQLFLWDTGTTVLKWHWHDCSQVTLAQLFTNETGTIVLKWNWHNCSQVRLAQLFPSGFWFSNLYFILQFVLWHDSSLVSFTWEDCAMYQDCSTLSRKELSRWNKPHFS